MFIQTEATPNPRTLKYLPGQTVAPGVPRDFRSPEEAGASPLARRLFALGDVTGVFLGADFISVTRTETADWRTLKPMVLAAIMEHYMSGEPAVEGEAGEKEEFYDPEDAGLVSEIKEILDTRIRPAVAQDGGDINFHGYKDGVVYLRLVGACAGCPSATATLKQGVENILKHFLPQIVEVRQVLPAGGGSCSV